MIDLNAVKKKLYKENHIAKLQSVRKDGIMYQIELMEGNIVFMIPYEEIGEVIWRPEMEAKHLIRYIVKE